MKIKTHINLFFGTFVVTLVMAIFGLNYLLIRNNLITNAKAELATLTKDIKRSAETMLRTSVSNYLRGATETHLETIETLYRQVGLGRISKQEAKDQIHQKFLYSRVGESGYPVAVLTHNYRHYLDIHPYLRGVECTNTEGCQAWARVRNGYTEYEWKNPRDQSFRRKAAYVLEFPEWNWLVGTSSYLDEFVKLVKVEDLKKLIAPIIIKKTGYFFVIDQNWMVLIHPELEGQYAGDLRDVEGLPVIQNLLDSATGYLDYTWQNSTDSEPRRKFAYVEPLEGFGWYLVATGYHDEILEPLDYLNKITIIIAILAGSLYLLLTVGLNRRISSPLTSLTRQVTSFYREQLPLTWKGGELEEIDILGGSFATMSAELATNMRTLQDKLLDLARSEAEKEKSNSMLLAIIESMPSAIFTLEPDLTIRHGNQQVAELANQKTDAIAGQALCRFLPELSPYEGALKKAVQKRETVSFIYETKAGGEPPKSYELTFYPIADGQEGGAVVRIDNISKRIEIEQQLRHSQKMDAIGQLAGGVAHDFNNMLSGIMGAADLLRVKLGPEHQGLIRLIITASGRARELVDKLLAFSRKEQITQEPVDLHQIIDETADILRRTLNKKIDIATSLHAENSTILGSGSQLQNGLLNIGINAGHAMPDGGDLVFTTSDVTLDAEYCNLSSFALQPGRYLKISIRDTGVGMDKDLMKRIFEPFFTTREQGKGTGLGLAAVYGTVVQHGGEIRVYSEQRVGSDFHLLLPAASTISRDPQHGSENIQGRGLILVIDDESVVRETAKLILEKLGYRVLEAKEGAEGVRLYQQQSQAIDLVLLDMLMPIMDGSECFRRLRQVNPKVRILLSSGFSKDADLQGMIAKGLTGYVRKPYSVSELSLAVAGVLQTAEKQ